MSLLLGMLLIVYSSAGERNQPFSQNLVNILRKC